MSTKMISNYIEQAESLAESTLQRLLADGVDALTAVSQARDAALLLLGELVYSHATKTSDALQIPSPIVRIGSWLHLAREITGIGDVESVDSGGWMFPVMVGRDGYYSLNFDTEAQASLAREAILASWTEALRCK